MEKKKLGFVLNIISLGLLVPGLILPIFTVKLETGVTAMIASFSGEVLNDTRSVLGTIQDLFSDGRWLVSLLILLFSVIIPIVKLFLLFRVQTLKESKKTLAHKLKKIIALISKWSMADIFLVAILLSFLATDAKGSNYSKTLSVFGSNIPVKVHSLMESSLGLGFYFFLGYCLISMVSAQLTESSLESFE